MFHVRVDDDLDLRLLTEADTQPLFTLIEANREYLRQWLSWVDDTRTPGSTRRFIEAGLTMHANNSGLQAGVWFRGQLAGVVSLNHIDHMNKQTEIGYWLGRDFQGQGIMTRACAALTGYVFEELAMQHVEIRCAVDNQKSRAIPERLGYEIEGTSMQLDWYTEQYINTVVYGLSAKDRPPQDTP